MDTTPGANCILAPDLGQDLTPDGYRNLIRERYRTSQGARQQLAVFARRSIPAQHRDVLRFTGPWSREARSIVAALAAPASTPATADAFSNLLASAAVVGAVAATVGAMIGAGVTVCFWVILARRARARGEDKNTTADTCED